MTAKAHVLLIGGRSGAGKTTAAYEVSAQLQAADVAHCLIDGDNLDAVYPKPADDPDGAALTERNLRSLWRAYAALGQRRVIYVNTASVLDIALVTRALGGDVQVSAALLTATDATVSDRLARREIGSTLVEHLERSAAMAVRLSAAPEAVHRLVTDNRSVADVATELIGLTGWLPPGS